MSVHALAAGSPTCPERVAPPPRQPAPGRFWRRGGAAPGQALQNVGVLFADRLWRLGGTFLLETWLARSLGAEQYGRWSFLVAAMVLLAPVAHLGLESVVVRALVRGDRRAGETLGTAAGLRLAGGLVAWGLTVAFVAVASPGNDRGAVAVAALLGSGLIFQTAEVFDYWFQSRVEARYSVLARNLGFAAAGVGKVLCIWQRAPLAAFAGLAVAELALCAGTLLGCYLRRRAGGPEGWLRVSGGTARRLLRESWPLAVAALAVAAGQRADQLLMRALAGARAAGQYAVASQLSEASYFVAVVVVSTLLPAILRARADVASYRTRLQETFDLLVGTALLISGVLSITAPLLVRGLFGPDYAPAAAVLSIHAWAAVFFYMGVAQSAWFLAEGLTMWSGLVVTLGAGLNVALNLWLIPRLGITGAAWAKLISYAVGWFVLNGIFPPTRPVFLMQLRALWPFGRLARRLRGLRSPGRSGG